MRKSITSDTNVSFKQLCSPVTAVTVPSNCVVYRDIRLLKSPIVVASPAIAWAMRLPNFLVSVVLCCVIPLREASSAQYVYLVNAYTILLMY